MGRFSSFSSVDGGNAGPNNIPCLHLVSANEPCPGARNFSNADFSINLIKAAFLLVMISLTRVLSISWKGLSAGIALGLGISAAADVGASWLMSQASNISSGTVDMIRMGGFQICVVVWLAYIVRRGETCELSGNDLPPFDVEASVQELQRITQR